ncbi:MAG: hypothetical protein AB8B91_02895 [Rubripirellula sp.]
MQNSPDKIANRRVRRFELLESRQMLSADGFDCQLGTIEFESLTIDDLQSHDVDTLEANRSETDEESKATRTRKADRVSTKRTRILGVATQPEGESVVSDSPEAGTDVGLIEVTIESEPLVVIPPVPVTVAPSDASSTLATQTIGPVISISVVNLLGSNGASGQAVDGVDSNSQDQGSAETRVDAAIQSLVTIGDGQSALKDDDGFTRLTEATEFTSVVRPAALAVSDFGGQVVSIGSLEASRGNDKALSITSFSATDRALHDWLGESRSIQDDLAHLERILELIGVTPSTSNAVRYESHAADGTVAALPDHERDLILLAPEVAKNVPTKPISGDVLERLDDSMKGWAVGIGFHRVIEFAGEVPARKDPSFAPHSATRWLSDLPPQDLDMELEAEQPLITWEMESVSATTHAIGVFVCCASLRYIKRRGQRTR